MTVRLRPHHLLCMLTYVGEGYSQDFVDNYDAIAARLSAGEEILIVTGPDDLCAPVMNGCGAHCRNDSVTRRDERAARDAGLHLACRIEAGVRLRLAPQDFAALREAFHEGTVRAACAGCEWSELCTTVAKNDYAGVRVSPAPAPSP